MRCLTFACLMMLFCLQSAGADEELLYSSEFWAAVRVVDPFDEEPPYCGIAYLGPHVEDMTRIVELGFFIMRSPSQIQDVVERWKIEDDGHGSTKVLIKVRIDDKPIRQQLIDGTHCSTGLPMCGDLALYLKEGLDEEMRTGSLMRMRLTTIRIGDWCENLYDLANCKDPQSVSVDLQVVLAGMDQALAAAGASCPEGWK